MIGQSLSDAGSAAVRLLEVDRGLADAIPSEDRNAAMRLALAPLVLIEEGKYEPTWFDRHEVPVGLLVIDGLMIRRVVVAGRNCGELIAAGELLRPWEYYGENAPMPTDLSWRVLERTRLALLDERFLRLTMRWPQLNLVLLERAVRRAQTLAFNIGIHSLQHVDLRLLYLLWHYADRFGRVTLEGTLVPLRLSHADLAELTGTQRPSVSKALGELEREGVVTRRPDRSWLLRGEPPSELRDLRKARRQ